MSKTTVVNIKRDEFDVYIGRPMARGRRLTPNGWGNPYHIGVDGSREECIEKYRAYILRTPWLLARLPELRDKRLGCWCAPLACHGDVLVELTEASS